MKTVILTDEEVGVVLQALHQLECTDNTHSVAKRLQAIANVRTKLTQAESTEE